ncbi:hypothetical protein PF008_g17266 [Phytophthora fragariae]|uniref:Peptidase A2 domain-containing protein n=1 Tax=Phytophthora fragariae TaxID=53985 RepID=A0A6G0R8R2_9STRA|nr:hypothetical protein PF008_g17266 [Phytophthora fragariae]
MRECSPAVADEKEEYEKELEERLFPLDEIELQRRMKKKVEQQKELSLTELSALLDIPEEKLTRARDSSPGVLSSPEYWLRWYKETLDASEAAKRANRDFRSNPEDQNQAPKVTSVHKEAGSERFAEVGGDTSGSDRPEPPQPAAVNEATVAENIATLLQPGGASTIASVSPPTPAATESVSPSRRRALVRRTAYLLVKGEEPLGNSPCATCLSPPSTLSERVEELGVETRRPDDGPHERARAVVDHFGLTNDERLIEQILDKVLEAYSRNATQILAKVVERGLRCPRCRSLSELQKRGVKAKRVSFDCSSLFSSRSEALGAHGSRYDREESIHEYVYSVSAPSPKRNRKAGLLEVPEQPEPDNDCTSSLPRGKRLIGSVGGVEAVSVGFIDCVQADLLIDTGAVASLIDARMLKLIGRAYAPLRPCRRDLNSASGHPLRIKGAIDLPLQLGSLEKTRPFIVVEKLHIDVSLGTDALKAFRAVVDLDENVVTLKSTGEKFSIGSPRVEEMYSSRISSTVRIRPGGQALVVTNVQGEIGEDVTVLVEWLVDLGASVRVARSLCTVQEKKVIVEVCNPSTEEMVIKKGTPLAAISVVPESAFSASAASSPVDGAEPFSPEENASSKRESDWIHAAIAASPTAENASSESMPELDKVLETELKVDFSDSKLGSEQKELFSGLLNSFRDLFV